MTTTSTPHGFRRFFGDEDHATHEQMNRRRLLFGGMMLPLFFLIALPLAYIGLLHAPSPNHMKIDIVGPPTVTEPIIAGVTAQQGHAFDLTSITSGDEARSRVSHLDARASYEPATGSVYVASAGNMQSTAAATRFLTALAGTQGQQVHVIDLAPLPKDDALGTGVMYVGLGALLGGFLTATVTALTAPRLANRAKVGVVLGMSAVATIVELVIGYGIMHTLSGHAWQVAGILFLLAATCGLLNLGGFLTIGPVMLFVSLTLFIMLGVPSSGVPVGTDMASSFYQFLQPYLPTSAALDALKRMVYFDGHGVGPRLLTMAVWLAIGVVLVLISTIRQKSGKKPAIPTAR